MSRRMIFSFFEEFRHVNQIYEQSPGKSHLKIYVCINMNFKESYYFVDLRFEVS
jgi:hypothetical protein